MNHLLPMQMLNIIFKVIYPTTEILPIFQIFLLFFLSINCNAEIYEGEGEFNLLVLWDAQKRKTDKFEIENGCACWWVRFDSSIFGYFLLGGKPTLLTKKPHQSGQRSYSKLELPFGPFPHLAFSIILILFDKAETIKLIYCQWPLLSS